MPKPTGGCLLRGAGPLRPPDWRYGIALALLDSGWRPGPEHDDRDVRRLRRLLQRLRAGQTARLPRVLSPYAAAFELYTEPDEHRRAVLEAHVLARQPSADVAQALGVPLAVVECYERSFFDVADRLHADAFVRHHVLRLYPDPEPSLGNVLRSFAYAGGPRVLDDLLCFLLPEYASRRSTPEHDSVLPRALWLRAAVASWLIPANKKTAAALIKLDLRRQHIDPRHEKWRRDKKAMRNHLNDVIALLGKAYGRTAISTNPFLCSILYA